MVDQRDVGYTNNERNAINIREAEDEQTDSRGGRNKERQMLTALLIGAFVAFLNENLLANALPGLMREFGRAAATIQWLSTVYMLVIGVLVPVTALLQQWFTTRQMFMSAMALFVAGTGIALFVGIMSSGANRYLHHSLNPTAVHEKTQSMISGLQTVFWIEFILAVLILVLGWFIKKPPEHS